MPLNVISWPKTHTFMNPTMVAPPPSPPNHPKHWVGGWTQRDLRRLCRVVCFTKYFKVLEILHSFISGNDVTFSSSPVTVVYLWLQCGVLKLLSLAAEVLLTLPNINGKSKFKVLGKNSVNMARGGGSRSRVGIQSFYRSTTNSMESWRRKHIC